MKYLLLTLITCYLFLIALSCESTPPKKAYKEEPVISLERMVNALRKDGHVILLDSVNLTGPRYRSSVRSFSYTMDFTKPNTRDTIRLGRHWSDDYVRWILEDELYVNKRYKEYLKSLEPNPNLIFLNE